MQAIKAIYDGKEFKTLEPIPVKGKYVVAITFIEPADNKYCANQHCLL